MKSSFRFSVSLLVLLQPWFALADECTTYNAMRVQQSKDSCAAVTCSTATSSCDGIFVGKRVEQAGTWAMAYHTYCTLPLPPWLGVYNGLRDCSEEKGLSVISGNEQEISNIEMVCRSGIRVEEQTLNLSIPITGASFGLSYSSNFVDGNTKKFSGTINLSSNTIETDISSFDIAVERDSLATLNYSYLNDTANRSVTISWDGKDSLGNDVQGSKKHKVTVTEHLVGYDFPVVSEVSLGGFRSHFLGLGGWAPSNLKYYDVVAKKMIGMTGETLKVEAKPFATGQVFVAANDAREVYIFDSSNGRHLFTKTGITGTTVYSFVYDVNGHLSEVQEPFSRTTTFDRNILGKLVSITSPSGRVTSLGFNPAGTLSSVQNPNSETHTMTYGAGGLLSTITKPGGQTHTYVYDADGALLSDTHSGGSLVALSRNTASSFKHELGISTALGRTSVVKTNESGNVLTRNYRDPMGLSENYQLTQSSNGSSEVVSGYGEARETSLIDDPRFQGAGRYTSGSFLSVSSIFRQNSNSLTTTLSNPSDPFSITSMSFVSQLSGKNTRISTDYDAATKTFEISSFLGKTLSVVIDTYERILSSKRGAEHEIEYGYVNEKLVSISQDTRTISFGYNATTQFLETITNALGQVTSFVRDGAGRVVSKILPDARVVGFSYDSNGNILSVTPPSRPAHYFSINAHELAGSYSPPVLSGVPATATTYQYDLDRQLTQVDRPDGASIVLSYNLTSGWLESYTTPDGTFLRTFDWGNGKPYTLTMPTGERTIFSYIGTIVSMVTNYNSTSSKFEIYARDFTNRGLKNSDRVSTESDGPSVISNVYNDDEDPTNVGDLDLSYQVAEGRLSGTTIGSSPNMVSDVYTYDSYGELSSYQAKYGATTIFELSLGRDASGRINQKNQSMNSVTDTFDYVFDISGRLNQTSKNSVVYANYGYDSNSNRTSGNIGAQVTTASYDDQDRLSSYNTLSFTYNANGDLESTTNASTSSTSQYAYDVFGNLTQVILSPSTTITYQVDALNRRVGKSVNGVLQKRWIYMDQYRIAAEVSPAGSITKRFVYASKGNIPDYMISGGENYRIISDHLGSPRLVVKVSDGTIAQRMNHDEYGRVTEDTNPGYLPFGFAGGLYDDQTGLVRFGARDYDPETGRWTSKDPILFNGGDTNLFGYVANDPVNWVDPSGLRINDQTGGRIPLQVVNSPLYRILDALPGTFTIKIDDSLNAAGVTRFRLGDLNQTILINENNQLNSYDLQDTYIHEFNHAILNFAFNGRTGEFFDTNILLPGQINKNLKGPGLCSK